MAQAPQPEPLFTAERYFALVDEGALQPDDRVELLEGVIVAGPPQGIVHSALVSVIAKELWKAVGDRAAIRTHSPLVVGSRSVPEPDVAGASSSPRGRRSR